jgi:hypothetical protein
VWAKVIGNYLKKKSSFRVNSNGLRFLIGSPTFDSKVDTSTTTFALLDAASRANYILYA